VEELPLPWPPFRSSGGRHLLSTHTDFSGVRVDCRKRRCVASLSGMEKKGLWLLHEIAPGEKRHV
jgi:hypothetical protein